MNTKKSHPFKIKCRNCGSTNVTVKAFGFTDIEIKCLDCFMSVECGHYFPGGDYSDWVYGWKDEEM